MNTKADRPLFLVEQVYCLLPEAEAPLTGNAGGAAQVIFNRSVLLL